MWDLQRRGELPCLYSVTSPVCFLCLKYISRKIITWQVVKSSKKISSKQFQMFKPTLDLKRWSLTLSAYLALCQITASSTVNFLNNVLLWGELPRRRGLGQWLADFLMGWQKSLGWAQQRRRACFYAEEVGLWKWPLLFSWRWDLGS